MNILDTPNLPDPANVSNTNLALRYGAIWAGVGVLTQLVGFLTDTDASLPTTSTAIKAVYSIVGFGIAIWAVAAAIREDRDKQLGGFISLGRCVGLGAKIGAISGIISGVFSMIYMKFINTGFAEQMKEAMMTEYEKQGLSEEQIEMAYGMASKFMSPTIIGISAAIGGVVIGLIIGLIAGAIMKRDALTARK